MVRVSDGAADTVMNGALAPASLANMSFGPASVEEDHSFIVLDRITAEDSERIESELAASVHGVQSNGGPSLAGSVSRAVSNHFGEVPPAPVTSALPNGESLSLSAHEPGSLPSDIQQRMDSLLQDNAQLQVTVDQTNIALRQMMNTLSDWRVEMEKVRQEHKEKFQETRSLVLKLKKEKAEMRAVNEEYQTQFEDVRRVNEELHIKAEELQSKVDELQHSQLPSLFENLVPSVDEMEFKTTIADLQSQLNVVESVCQAEKEKSAAYEEELELLKREMGLMKTQVQHVDALKKDAELHESVLDELKILQEENVRLKHDVQNLSCVERHSQDYQVAQAKGFTQKVDELTAKLIRAEEELKKAQTEIFHLNTKHNSLGANEETLNNALSTVERLRLRIDEMTARIIELEQKCEDQTREVGTLNEESNRLRRENEAVGILQAQMEVYRADFIAERDCRERLAGEKEQLAEDLRRLHRRNLELQEGQGPNILHPAEGNADEERAQPAAGEANQSFRCPICTTMTFRTLQFLNEHLDRCLDPPL